MRQVNPAVRDLARQLLAAEAGDIRAPHEAVQAAERACAKLRLHLVRLVGLEGFRALLVRALALATADVPWLRAVQVQPDGSLQGLSEAATQQEGAGVAEGYAALLAQLFGLLITFVGETLTLRLAREIWPEAALGDTLSRPQEEAQG
jgi:hypothetical protein